MTKICLKCETNIPRDEVDIYFFHGTNKMFADWRTHPDFYERNASNSI